MLEVFLFGALVSYTRLVDLASVEIGPAAGGLGLLVLTLAAADATVETGFWPLALIVFLASIAVPLLKLAGLAAMLLGVRRRSTGGLRAARASTGSSRR